MGKRGCCGCCCFLFFIVIVATVVAIVVLWKEGRISPPWGGVDRKYGDALGVAMKFFDVQKAGKLVNNKISWRGDSALQDGSDAKLDLSKGMYDAGDRMKFGFPMAFTATVLSWSILEYGDQLKAAKQLDSALDSLKWLTDFFINAHPSDNLLYIQVGDPNQDHKCWQRPEDMTAKRPLTKIDPQTPGSEVAAETAAALASASLVFRTKDSAYSDVLLQHARKLFSFANSHRGSYSKSIPAVQEFYNSTGYHDELLWAASWLYLATGNEKYLSYVTTENGESFADWGKPTWFSWDDKRAGTQVLLSRVHFLGSGEFSGDQADSLEMYKQTAEAVMCGLLPDSPSATDSRSDGGLIWINEWNALQHPVAASFLAVLYSDYMLTSKTSEIDCSGTTYSPKDLRNFAISQADYLLGDNPMKLSYLVGYGSQYPQQVHHRGASIPEGTKTGCNGFQWLTSTDPNPNVAMGALVGGPFQNDSYIDNRNNSMQGEPCTYNSALLVGLLSGLAADSSVPSSLG